MCGGERRGEGVVDGGVEVRGERGERVRGRMVGCVGKWWWRFVFDY